MDEAVRDYMAAIGRKGGAAGKGTKERRELNRKAARIRWANHRKKKRLKIKS